MTRPFRCWGLFLVLLLSGLVAGCGGKKDGEISGVPVKGQLLMNGQPLKLIKDEEIQISFIKGTGTDQVGSAAEFNPADSTFEVKGPSGNGIPPGDYKIGIRSEIYGGGTDGDEEVNRFAAFESGKTPLTATVGSEEGQTFIIDLQKRTVTKK